MKKVISLLLAVVMMIPMFAFSTVANGQEVKVAYPSVWQADSSQTINVGVTKTLEIVHRSLVKYWRTSDPSIISVNNKGKVTAKKVGYATVSASFDDYDKEVIHFYINVVDPKLAKKSVSLKAGKTSEISVKGIANAKATFKSTDSKIAKVNKNGKVTALKKGKAKIKITVGDNKLTYSVKVTSSPKLSCKEVTVKKDKTKSVKIIGKAKNVNNKYTNTSTAKVISKKSSSSIRVKGIGKGTSTLKIKVNGVTLKLIVNVK